MSSKLKLTLIALGVLSILLILTQLGLALAILQTGTAILRKSHQHTGYLTVAVSLAYIILSLKTVASTPTK